MNVIRRKLFFDRAFGNSNLAHPFIELIFQTIISTNLVQIYLKSDEPVSIKNSEYIKLLISTILALFMARKFRYSYVEKINVNKLRRETAQKANKHIIFCFKLPVIT